MLRHLDSISDQLQPVRPITLSRLIVHNDWSRTAKGFLNSIPKPYWHKQTQLKQSVPKMILRFLISVLLSVGITTQQQSLLSKIGEESALNYIQKSVLSAAVECIEDEQVLRDLCLNEQNPFHARNIRVLVETYETYATSIAIVICDSSVSTGGLTAECPIYVMRLDRARRKGEASLLGKCTSNATVESLQFKKEPGKMLWGLSLHDRGAVRSWNGSFKSDSPKLRLE